MRPPSSVERPQLTAGALATLVGAAVCACAMTPADEAVDATAVLKSSFKANGQATMDRLDQDDTQRLCSRFAAKSLPPDVARKIEKENLSTIKYPADGKLLGDWKNGEKIAQEGRGKQFSDDPSGPVGGNCYACHQLAPQELSYGTIGPSLYQFGKLRGYGEDVQRYVFGKIYNPDAYAACSNMPRFGHHRILSEQQIKDVTALLMDPASPVNR